MTKKNKLKIKNPKLIYISKLFTSMLYALVFIACIPLSLFISFAHTPLTWLYDGICNNFHLYFCYFGSGDDSMLQLFFLFIPAGFLFAIFYFGVQLIAKYVGKEKIDMRLKLKNFLLNIISFIIFYLIFCSIDISKTIFEGIRMIICNITFLDFCDYNVGLFSFPNEKVIYLVFLVWFFIVAFCIYLLYKIYLFKRNLNGEEAKSKYYYLIFLIIISLIPLFVYISIFPFDKKTMEEIGAMTDEEIIIYVNKTRIFNDEVDKMVDKFNYCETNDDCGMFRGPYPFKCNEVVNKEKVEVSKAIMNNMVKKYNWNGPQFCEDSVSNPICENNKCIFEKNEKDLLIY